MTDPVIQGLESKRPMCFAQGTICAPIKEVWPFLGAIGTEKLFIPGVIKSAWIEGFGVGSRRKITIPEGVVYETIVAYDPDRHFLAYVLDEGQHPFPVKGLCGVVTAEALPSGFTQLTWRTFFDDADPETEKVIRENANSRFRTAIGNLAKLAEQ